MILATALAILNATAWSQSYPSKTIRLITSEPGGAGDFSARIMAQGLSAGLGSTVVENRGGTGVIAAELVAKSPPDGHTLLSYGSNIWLIPFLEDNVPYDPVRDFAPVTLAMRSPCLIVVHPSLPVHSVRELVALAKARPGELNYAAGGTGGTPHIAAELFKSMAGVNIVRIPYKGTGPAVNSLVGGHVQLMFPTASSVTAHLRSGRLRALAVTTAQSSVLAPGLPTATASGLPGYEASSIQVLFTPAGTPSPIIARLNQEVARHLSLPETREKLLNSGVESVASSPEVLSATIKSEMSRLGKLIKDTGMKGQ